VNYSEIIIELEKASLFDLSRLASAIRNELADTERIDKVKNTLVVGQIIIWFNNKINALVEAEIIKCNKTSCEVENLSDKVRWNVAYCYINIENVAIDINRGQKRGLKKYELQLGEVVTFLDQQHHPLYGKVVKLNPKMVSINVNGGIWKVCYTLLSKPTDVDAEIINKNFIDMK
jgi:hypothetical protein